MSEKELIRKIKELPSEAQKEAADFVDFLYKKYIKQGKKQATSRESVLESSFRVIGKDREDMQDSTEWIRKIRKNRWAG